MQYFQAYASDALRPVPRRGRQVLTLLVWMTGVFMCGDSVRSEIIVGPVVIQGDKLAHSFRDLGNSAVAQNILVGDGESGEKTPAIETALGEDDELSFTLMAPPGHRIVIRPGKPIIEEVHLLNNMKFAVQGTTPGDLIKAAVRLSFENLEGTAPAIFSDFSSIEADGNQIALGTVTTEYFSDPIAFTAMTYHLTYPGIDSKRKTYLRSFGDIRARMLFQYRGSQDPGPFITIESLAMPALSIRRLGNNIEVAWTSPDATLLLETAAVVGPKTQWIRIWEKARIQDDHYDVTLRMSAGPAYYRLRRPPL